MRAGQRVLELGCGTGLFTEMMAVSGASVVATDISAELLELARARVRGVGNVSLVLCDGEALPFRDRSFDAVIGSSILHHLPVESSLREIQRVLSHHGSMVFAEPNMLNPQIAIQKNVPAVKAWLGDSPDETAFVRWRLHRLLRSMGFSEITIEPYDFLHPVTPRVLIPLIEGIGRLTEKIPLLREVAGSLIISARRAPVEDSDAVGR